MYKKTPTTNQKSELMKIFKMQLKKELPPSPKEILKQLKMPLKKYQRKQRTEKKMLKKKLKNKKN